ncbi:hypothetical protein QBC32DRAFT_374836 [Pseudoneurospora amorphoporcata]|uniref:Kinesin light chain n=1 Tax=Pseudoneurospora amorphoporcata TaxID=241081 RepID=A0AAN6SAI5_9PEZI|nr:hypothetical protein QBC32DRAFT_374836 [Pseudoneurospora amorphoporcata]
MWLKAYGQEKTFRQQYIERIAASFPTGQVENWSICRTLFAQARVALDYQPSENTQMLVKAKEVRERRLGKDDVATLSSTSLLALVFRDRGLWKEAEKLEVQVLETSKAELGADHPSTLTSMNNLASTYRNQ